MVNEIVKSWRTIVQVLIQSGYYEMYEKEVKRVADYLRETGVENILKEE